uniref:RING-type E3 ubiquitin transferase n=1 Tax=Lotharella globosa TaxID=91324 RepID=A0A7S3Z346_9EUKA
MAHSFSLLTTLSIFRKQKPSGKGIQRMETAERGWLGWASDGASSLASRLGLLSLDGPPANGGGAAAQNTSGVSKRSRRAANVEIKDDCAEIDDNVSDKKAQMGQNDGPCPSASQPMPGNLLAILECPVCMIVYQDRVMMCSNGHSICGKCLESLPDSRCPTCRVKMGTIRNRIVERMLETALLPCVYRDYGCKYVGRGKSRASHEATCMFRPIPCLLRRCYPSCKWEGPPSSLVEHLNTHCSVRNVDPDTLDDVYWSYKTDKDCFQRGKDAAYFLPWCQRFYYVSISKRGDLFHLAALWFALSPKAAEEAQRRIKMELVFPLDKNQSVSYSLYPPRLLPGEVLDDQISHLIKTNQSFIVPIRRWRREWSESKHKCYFQVRARWTEPSTVTRKTISLRHLLHNIISSRVPRRIRLLLRAHVQSPCLHFFMFFMCVCVVCVCVCFVFCVDPIEPHQSDGWKPTINTEGNPSRRKASMSPPAAASAPCPPSPGSVASNSIEGLDAKKRFGESKAPQITTKTAASVPMASDSERANVRFPKAETRGSITGSTPPRLSLLDLEPTDKKQS